MKPITEHEDYIELKDKEILIINQEFATSSLTPSREFLYDTGAIAAQSILQSEHDKEIEKILKWFEHTGYSHDGEGWVDVRTDSYETDFRPVEFKYILEEFRNQNP